MLETAPANIDMVFVCITAAGVLIWLYFARSTPLIHEISPAERAFPICSPDRGVRGPRNTSVLSREDRSLQEDKGRGYRYPPGSMLSRRIRGRGYRYPPGEHKEDRCSPGVRGIDPPGEHKGRSALQREGGSALQEDKGRIVPSWREGGSMLSRRIRGGGIDTLLGR
jgi:hypothetical protein